MLTPARGARFLKTRRALWWGWWEGGRVCQAARPVSKLRNCALLIKAKIDVILLLK
jgi:hypothetical protein